MNQRTFGAIFAACLTLLTTGTACAEEDPASTTGAADTADSPTPTALKAEPEVVEAWKDMRFGMFIHWGPVALTEKEIGWSRGLAEGEQDKPLFKWIKKTRSRETATPAKEYDELYKKWNPENFNADEWVRIAKDTGQKYLIFVAKHHDGFCLFDSKLTDYKTTAPESKWKVDAVKELAAACHKHGLKFIIYYSQPDWHHPDYLTENHDRYVKYLHGQVREILTNYGRIDGLWFDNLRPVNQEIAELWDAENLFKMARSIQPHLIINNRCGLEGDFETPEQHVGHFSRDRSWESCITLGTQWAWKSGDKLKSHEEAIKMLVVCAVGDGNLALNTNPMPDGRIEPRQAESFRKIGQWTRKYGQSIYGTRGGPFVAPDSAKRTFNADRDQFNLPGGRWWGGSTHKDNTVYLHILRWPNDTIILPGIGRKVVSYKVLTGGEAKLQQTKHHIAVSVPKDQRDQLDTIIEIQFDKSVTDVTPVKAGVLGSQPGEDPAASLEGFTWPSAVPDGSPFPPSKTLEAVRFTGRHQAYRAGDTWYPCWAEDGNLYSPWTDGGLNGLVSGSSKGAQAKTGHAVMIGDDPLNLELRNTSPPKVASALPYQGRYPGGSLVHNGVWYYGTYCLGPDTSSYKHNGVAWNWPYMGPMPGFQVSTDYGKTWKPSPLSPEKPLFPEPAKFLGTVKMGAPHFVDFGKNMEHSPDGKAYLLGMGAEEDDPHPRPCLKRTGPGVLEPHTDCDSDFKHANLSWISADQVYLSRVTPSPETMNDIKAYEFFAGHGADGEPLWTSDFSKIKPLIEWNNNMGCAAATWVPGLNKYLMCVTDGWPTMDKMDSYILEADKITGPWRMVTYMKDFGEQGFFLNFPSKFISTDGKTLWLCYSANFSPGHNGENMKRIPPGVRGTMRLHEIQLLPNGGSQ